MNLKHIHFLSKSNIKRNKNSGTITLLICLLTIAVTVISCFSVTTSITVNKYENDYRARALKLFPALKPISKQSIEAIYSLDNVEAVVDIIGLKGESAYKIIESDDKQLNDNSRTLKTHFYINSLFEGEYLSVLNGENLEDTPAFSCLVPSMFYPYQDIPNDYKNIDYIDGASLIGKKIKVKGANNKLNISYFSMDENDCLNQLYREFTSPEFTLTIVGTYPCSYSTTGSFIDLFVSKETDMLMAKMTFEGAGVDLSKTDDSLSLWWNTPEYHEYCVIVDDFDNISEVSNTIRKEMGYSISGTGEKHQDEIVKFFAIIFKFVGTFLTASILLISVVLLIYSSVMSMREKKAFIGLMKAIGYKNHQIFFSLIYEQLYMTMRAFLIGGVISTLVVFLANLKFEHGTYRQMQYIISWNTFGFFLMIAFLIAFLVPLVTELLLLNKLVKIEPREAMSSK